MKTAITYYQARAKLGHRTDLNSSQKGIAMNRFKVFSKSCFALVGIALAVALAPFGQTVPVQSVPVPTVTILPLPAVAVSAPTSSVAPVPVIWKVPPADWVPR